MSDSPLVPNVGRRGDPKDVRLQERYNQLHQWAARKGFAIMQAVAPVAGFRRMRWAFPDGSQVECIENVNGIRPIRIANVYVPPLLSTIRGVGSMMDSGFLLRPYTYSEPVAITLSTELESHSALGTAHPTGVGQVVWMPGDNDLLGFRTTTAGEIAVTDHTYSGLVALKKTDKDSLDLINNYPAWRYSGLARLFVQAIMGADQMSYFNTGTGGDLLALTRLGVLIAPDMRVYLLLLPTVSGTTSELVKVYPLRPAADFAEMRAYLSTAIGASAGEALSAPVTAALAHYLSAQRLVVVDDVVQSYTLTVSGLASIASDRGYPVWGHWHWPYDPTAHECSAIFKFNHSATEFKTARVTISFAIPSAEDELSGSRITAALDTGTQSAIFTVLQKDRLFGYTSASTNVVGANAGFTIYGFYRPQGFVSVEYRKRIGINRRVGTYFGGAVDGQPAAYCEPVDISWSDGESSPTVVSGPQAAESWTATGTSYYYPSHSRGALVLAEEDVDIDPSDPVSGYSVSEWQGTYTYFIGGATSWSLSFSTPGTKASCGGGYTVHSAGNATLTGTQYWLTSATRGVESTSVGAASVSISPGRNRGADGTLRDNPDGVLFWYRSPSGTVSGYTETSTYVSGSVRSGTLSGNATGSYAVAGGDGVSFDRVNAPGSTIDAGSKVYAIGVSGTLTQLSADEDMSVSTSYKLRFEESFSGVARYSGRDIAALSNLQYDCETTDSNLAGLGAWQTIPLGWA